MSAAGVIVTYRRGAQSQVWPTSIGLSLGSACLRSVHEDTYLTAISYTIAGGDSIMRRIMAFSALLVVTALCLGSAALATPHATPKSCGYAGGPSCPATPPTVGPWFYSPWQPFVDVVPPNGFYTVSEVG